MNENLKTMSSYRCIFCITINVDRIHVKHPSTTDLVIHCVFVSKHFERNHFEFF